MTLYRLMLQSMSRFWRTNLGVMLGVALASTVITGALLVGDSMRYTLSQAAKQRLGNIEQAVIGGDRFFTDSLAQSFGEGSSGVIIAEGVASTPDGNRRANNVTLIGIDAAFAGLMNIAVLPAGNSVLINQPLKDQLGLESNETFIIRVAEPSALPIDAALVNASKPSLALQVDLQDYVPGNDEGGRFSLRAEQTTPLNVFVDRNWLADQLGQPGKVNLALSAESIGPFEPSLDDLQLILQPRGGQQELATDRIFLDPSIESDLADLPGQRILTYMVNTVALDGNESPYAMVTAANQLGNLDLADDEIAVNEWLAEDLGADIGDTLTLTYFLPDEGDRLVEASATLTIAQIVPLEGKFADRTLTPDFPGLAEADTLSRWDAGPAIDRSRIRDKDEAYWDDYRATPKAFINLETGQRLWTNRFGTLTAIRFDNEITEEQLLERIDAEALGLVVTDIKAQANAAAIGTVDFGQLFLSLSGFIIIAAIVLAVMLFTMSAEQRARQLGTLLALGLTRSQAMRLLLGEGVIVAFVGALLGVGGAVAYAYSVTNALAGVWSGAVAGSAVLLHMPATTLVIGPLVTLIICVLAMAIAIRGLTKHHARELLAGGVGKVSSASRFSWQITAGLAVAGIAIALLLAITNTQTGMRGALFGFAAGGVGFAGGLLLLFTVLIRRGGGQSPGPLLRWNNALSVLNLTRRRGRTLAGVFMLGAGLFLVYAVSGFQLSSTDDPTNRASGTGGFALLVETSQPIRYDLNTELGRDHYVLGEDELPTGSVVPFRVSGGDDASCLNLNQTPTPRLLGVDPALLADRAAFRFQKVAYKASGWGVLNASTPNKRGMIPVIADANTAQWALKIAVGDTVTVPDEQGRPVTLQLVGTIENTILQGSLIINERDFERVFPSTSGHRMLLVDAVSGQAAGETRELLNEVLVDEGATITPTNERLAEYNRVQNTYLAVFQSLGGLGVLLGSLGLGIVTARNLLERRSELALLSAVGLSRKRIARIVLTEHAVILIVGLSLGSASAWLATMHAQSSSSLILWTTALAYIAPLLVGLAAIVLGLMPALSGRLTDALRND
ncbi:MAG: FtsX-like permease family protein [Planctomycetota bacterium]